MVALVADHGENLGEHGILFRHIGLFETTTHVPLMIRWPGAERSGRSLPGLVQTIDLFPTLLAAAGLKPPPSDGQDLRELTDHGKAGRRAVFTEHSDRMGVSVRTRGYRYGWNEGNLPKLVPDGPYLYDLKADPGETRNLAGRGLAAKRSSTASSSAGSRITTGGRAPRRGSLPRRRRKLRSLGYGG